MPIPALDHSGLSEAPVATGGNAASWNGFLDAMTGSFNDGVKDLNAKLTTALSLLQRNPTDPAQLAAVQSALAEYSIYRNAQTNTTKAFKDIAAATIQNFR